MSRPLVTWGGLDFDTSEMDLELREALATVAPEGGALQALSLTARVRDARDAAQADAAGLRIARAEAQGCDLEDSTPTELAADVLVTALAHLAEAQAALFEANDYLSRARRLLGLS